MEILLKILMEIDDSVNWQEETMLMDNHILDSLEMIYLIADIEYSFDIELNMEEITSDNFNSVDAIWKMILRIKQANVM